MVPKPGFAPASFLIAATGAEFKRFRHMSITWRVVLSDME
jgi:hypothetical protein